VIGALGGFETFGSIDAAEVAAGFHIPRPAEGKYSLAFGQTHIRGGFARPFSTTNYKYGTGDSEALRLDVGPISDWPPGALQQGTRAVIAGREGWMIRNDSVTIEFAFQCGDDGVEIWCQVAAPPQLGIQGLSDFVATLS
jgi:hypothetical protein